MKTSTQRVTWQDFGPTLRRLRKARGLSQERLALLLSYDRTHIWRLEHGDRYPSRHFLSLLAKTCEPSAMEVQVIHWFELLLESSTDVLEVGEVDVTSVSTPL